MQSIFFWLLDSKIFFPRKDRYNKRCLLSKGKHQDGTRGCAPWLPPLVLPSPTLSPLGSTEILAIVGWTREWRTSRSIMVTELRSCLDYLVCWIWNAPGHTPSPTGNSLIAAQKWNNLGDENMSIRPYGGTEISVPKSGDKRFMPDITTMVKIQKWTKNVWRPLYRASVEFRHLWWSVSLSNFDDPIP